MLQLQFVILPIICLNFPLFSESSSSDSEFDSDFDKRLDESFNEILRNLKKNITTKDVVSAPSNPNDDHNKQDTAYGEISTNSNNSHIECKESDGTLNDYEGESGEWTDIDGDDESGMSDDESGLSDDEILQ